LTVRRPAGFANEFVNRPGFPVILKTSADDMIPPLATITADPCDIILVTGIDWYSNEITRRTVCLEDFSVLCVILRF
jgi:hypothetical protein